MKLIAIVRSLRPAQWTKNAVVLAALVFALGDPAQVVGIEHILSACFATVLFCLASSSIYVMNDLHDLEKDRAHPVKRLRPFASGELSTRTGVLLAALLAITAVGGALVLHRGFLWALSGYFVLQVAYTFALKRIAFVDILIIASGFILRALAGGWAIEVPISNWLLSCTLLLSLFLALCKRRHELVVLSDHAGATRDALRGYDRVWLDRLIPLTALFSVIAYSAYTVAPGTVAKFGTHRLAWTIPYVAFGLFRYYRLVYRHEQGGRPEHVLLTDRTLLVTVLLYGITALVLLLLRNT